MTKTILCVVMIQCVNYFLNLMNNVLHLLSNILFDLKLDFKYKREYFFYSKLAQVGFG